MSELPGFQDFMRPLLELLAKEPTPLRAREVYEKLADAMNLGLDERAQLLPSRKQPTYRNRIGWASTYLRFAGLVQSPTRGVWAITEQGRRFLGKHQGPIDLRILNTIPAYVEARKAAEGDAGEDDDANAGVLATAMSSESTPEEHLFTAHRRIVGSVAEQLAELLRKSTPDFFEELVVDLLGRMGYGTSDEARVRVGRSGDGGAPRWVDVTPRASLCFGDERDRCAGRRERAADEHATGDVGRRLGRREHVVGVVVPVRH